MKTCTNCGWINQDLNLSIREWTCPSCNEHHDRDLNASKNILKQGINILSGYGIESDIKQKQEESLPLGESVIPEAQPSLVVGQFTGKLNDTNKIKKWWRRHIVGVKES